MDSTVNLDCEKEKVFGNVEFEDVLSLEDYCNDVTLLTQRIGMLSSLEWA